MKYISQMRAFYDVLAVKRLSTGQIALWHALMDKNNRLGWVEWFTAANITLTLSSGLSRQGIVKCRNALKQAGLIDFKGDGTKTTAYKMVVLYSLHEGTVANSVPDSVPIGVPDGVPIGVPDSGTLSRPKTKTKTKIKKDILTDMQKSSNAFASIIALLESEDQ